MKAEDFLKDTISRETLASALDPIKDELDAEMRRKFQVRSVNEKVLMDMMEYANNWLALHYPKLRVHIRQIGLEEGGKKIAMELQLAGIIP
jgi:hypothetical protein